MKTWDKERGKTINENKNVIGLVIAVNKQWAKANAPKYLIDGKLVD